MRLGAPSGRRTYAPQVLPNLGRMPFTQAQKAALDAQANAIKSAPPLINPAISLFNPPADAQTGRKTSLPASAYPAAGAGPVAILSFTVPQSKYCVIQRLAIVHNGGNPPDFTGSVIWRVLLNGGGYQGYNNLTAQIGTFSNPLSVVLQATENDTVAVTAEVPVGQVPPPGGTTTAASFDYFLYPLSEATLPQSWRQ